MAATYEGDLSGDRAKVFLIVNKLSVPNDHLFTFEFTESPSVRFVAGIDQPQHIDRGSLPIDSAILGQARVPVLPDDTPDTLAARVLTREHQLYPAVLRRFAAGDRRPVNL